MSGGGMGVANGVIQFLQGLNSLFAQQTTGSSQFQQSGTQEFSGESSSEQNASSIIEAIMSQISQGTEQTEGTEETQRLSDESLAGVQQQIQQILGDLQSGESFNQAQQATIDNIMESGMGQVIAAATNAGAYDSSVQGRAAERLSARAAREGATAGFAAENQLATQLANLLQSEALGKTATTRTGSTTSEQQTKATQNQSTEQTQTGSTTQSSTTKNEVEGNSESATRKRGLWGNAMDELGDIGDTFGF